MTGKSKIQWTDATWNPLAGCSIVSPGCTNCYAMRQAARIERMGGADHYVGLTEMVKDKPVWTGKVALASEKTLLAPLRWKKPRKIFVNSMTDLFHESVPDEWIDKIFAVMAFAPRHIFQVVTKRSKRMRDYICSRAGDYEVVLSDAAEKAFAPGAAPVSRHQFQARLSPVSTPEARALYDAPKLVWPLPNVWLLVTAEDQPRANERIPDLLATPAAVRGVSIEPQLGEIKLHNLPLGHSGHVNALTGETLTFDGDYDPDGPRLDWIICGGESGPGARPMHPDWARSLRDQCRAAGVQFFFKQWGPFIPGVERPDDGGIFIEFGDGDDFRVVSDGHDIVLCEAQDHRGAPNKIWKNYWASGDGRLFKGNSEKSRLLDGREHNDFPEPRP
jgi:protein gp37